MRKVRGAEAASLKENPSGAPVMQAAEIAGRPVSRSRVALAILLSLLLMLVLALEGISVWQGQQDARAALEARATNAAYVASAHVQWLLEANFQALRRIADFTSELSKAPRSDRLDLNEIVAPLPGEVPAWVFDAEGRSVLTNEPELAPIEVADSDYFMALKAGARRYIGGLLIDRAANRKVFPIGYRIERDGDFLGAAVVFVPADLMAQYWLSMNLGPGSTVGLLKDDGWLVARYPVPEGPLNLSNYVLFTEYLAQAPAGLYTAGASPADGIARLVAYRKVEDLPLVVVVGIPEETIAADFWERTADLGMVTLPVAFGLVLVSVWLVVLLRREEESRNQLSIALEDNRVLLREIHHRLKNNLQTVAAMVRLQPGLTGRKDELISRIFAMTAVHEHIYGSDRFGAVDIPVYIRTLVDGLQDSSASSATVECDLDPMEVTPDTALPLGLIVNEVVSNAFKHAFSDGREGRIDIRLETRSDGRGVLTVRDNGTGYKPLDNGGMGTRLIRSLTQQIDGEHEFIDDGGTIFRLEFPLPDSGPAASGANGARFASPHSGPVSQVR